MAAVEKPVYNINSLIEFADEQFNIYAQIQTTGQTDKRMLAQKDKILQYAKVCAVGDENDRAYVKNLVQRLITECDNPETPSFPKNYGVSPGNIDKFINWNDIDSVSAYVKFLAMLSYHKREKRSLALAYLLEKYELDSLRVLEDGEYGYYIDDKDIERIWKEENIPLDYNLKLDVLTQIVYEETKGNSCVDEILYQDVGDISIGVSGIPDSVSVHVTEGFHPAYEGYWVRYRGCSIHFRFVTFGSYEKMKQVVKQSVGYQMKGQFSEKEGFKLGYAKDGSRRTAVIEPFGESPAAWIRKFTEQSTSNAGLYGGMAGAENVMDVERVLTKGGATIPVCGGQGSGKTTKLESLTQYIQTFYSIRVIESEFEARLRWKYPHKNIFTVEANDSSEVTPDDAYNFSLRSAGDIYIIGEARSDDMIINVTRTANRGGRSVMFTFHPKTPEQTVPEIANALIRSKMYASLKDAIATALNTIKCCIFIQMDLEAKKRYYEIYEFVPTPTLLPDEFMRLPAGPDRELAFMKAMHAYMQNVTSADVYFHTIPIIVFDREKKEYVYKNTISNEFYNELWIKTPLQAEREEMERVFRPEKRMDAYLKANNIQKGSLPKPLFERVASDMRLNRAFIDYESYMAGMQKKPE